MSGFSIPTAQTTHKIYVFSTEVLRTRKNAIAVMIYAYRISNGEMRWGIGAERNTQVMLAHALIRAVTELLIHEEQPAIHVISSDTGLITYLNDYVIGWLRDGKRRSKDASDTWVELTGLRTLANFDVGKPRASEETLRFTNLQDFARDAIRPLAEEQWRNNPDRFQTTGVTLADDAPGAPKVMAGDR